MHEKAQVTTNHLYRSPSNTCSNIVLEYVRLRYRHDTDHVDLRFTVAAHTFTELQVKAWVKKQNWYSSCCFWRQTWLLRLPKLNLTFSTQWEEMFHPNACLAICTCAEENLLLPSGWVGDERVSGGPDRSSKLASVEVRFVTFHTCTRVGAASTVYTVATLHFCSLFLWGFLLPFCLISRVVFTLLPLRCYFRVCLNVKVLIKRSKLSMFHLKRKKKNEWIILCTCD